MNIEKRLQNNGTKLIPNPAYSKRAKKNPQPPQLIVPDTSADYSPFVDLSVNAGLSQQSIDANLVKKYHNNGLSWSPNRDLDTYLAEKQSNWTKAGNSLLQTVVSEIGLGTAIGFSDLFDFVLGGVFSSDNDYQNPIGAKLEEWQNSFNEYAPVHTKPGINIGNGGFSDFGWWMKNIPNIASSITLLIPARAVTAGVSKVGRLAKAARSASKAAKTIKNAEKYKTLAEAGKVSQAVKTEKELNAFQKALYNPMNQEKLRTAAKVSSEAVIMRTLENYQEARQTYQQMYQEGAEYLENMTPEEYNEFLEAHSDELGDVDVTNRDAVAKKIASKAADRTFAIDYSNTLFDVIQLYALRNIGRVPKNVKSSSVLAAQQESIQAAKQIGTQAVAKTATGTITKDAVKSAAKETAKIGIFKGTGRKIKNFATGTGKIVAMESTEGVEEAVNYIAQQEGITLGNTLLGKETNSTAAGFWNSRLNDYIDSPELWESAFWGLIGGVVFGAAGSKVNKVQFNSEALSRKKAREENADTKEKINTPRFISLRDEPEIARAKAAIGLRNTRLNDMQAELAIVEQGRDPRMPKGEDGKFPEIQGDEETVKRHQARIREEIISKYQTKMALEAINSGTFDLLLDYFRSEQVKQAMVATGMAESSTIDSFVNETLENLENIRDAYNNELAHVNYQVTALNSSNRRSEQIPLEYVQQIAASNVSRVLQMNYLDKEISRLEAQAAKEAKFSGISEAEQLNNKRIIRVAQLTELYGRLEADKKAVQNDPNLNEWRRVESIADIEAQQDGILRSIKEAYGEIGVYNNQGKEIKGTSAVAHQMGAALNAIRRAQRYVKMSDGSYGMDMSSSLVTKTDEEIVKSYEEPFNGNEQEISTLSQLSRVVNQDIQNAFKENSDMYNNNANLFDLYMNIANLETTRGIYARQINRSQSQIANKVDILHNRNNELRREIIDVAEETIRALHDKYKDTNAKDIERAVIKSFFNDKAEAYRIAKENLTGTDENGKSDAEKLMDALNIINFSQGANRQVFQYISTILQRNAEKHKAERGEINLNSTTSQNQSSAPQIVPTTNIPQSTLNPATSQATAENGQEQSKTIVSSDKKVRIVVRDDGTIVSMTNTNIGVGIIEYSDGSIELNISGAQRPTQRKYISTELFEEPGGAIIDSNTDWRVYSNPKLTYDETSKQYKIEEKGIIQIINNQTGTEVGTTEPATPETPATENGQEVVEENPFGSVIVEEGEVNYVEPQRSSTGGVQQTLEPTILNREQKSIIVRKALKNFVDLTDDNIDFKKVRFDVMNNLTVHNDGTFTDEEISELTNEIVDELEEVYNDNDEDDILGTAAANLTYQSRYEEFGEAGYSFTTAFTKAIDTFMEEYSKIALVSEIDGKKAVRMRDILRICNGLNPTKDTTLAYQIHGIIFNYLTSPEGREKYVVIDEHEASTGEVVENSVKTSEELLREQYPESFIPQSVNIRKFVESANELNDKKYIDALNALKVGDKLRMVNTESEYVLYAGDIKIGTLPKPNIKNGGYEFYNSGWRTDIRLGANSEVISDMKDLVLQMFTSDEEDCKAIRTLLIKAGLSQTNNVSDDMLDEFSNIPMIYNLINDSIDDYENYRDNLFYVEQETPDDVPRVNVRNVFNHLLSLWNYTFTTLNETSLEANKTLLIANTERWFAKLYEEYDIINSLPDSADVEIADISDGQLLKVTEGELNVNEGYNQANLIKNATNDTSKIRIGIVNPRKDGEIFVSNPSNFVNGKTIDDKPGFKRANPIIAVYGRNNEADYTHAFGVRTNDRSVNGDPRNNEPGDTDLYLYCRAARQALRDALTDYNNSRHSQAEFDRIEDVLRSIFHTSTTVDRIPMFIHANNGDTISIHPVRYTNSPNIKGIALDYTSAATGQTKNINIISHGNHGPMFAVQIDKQAWVTATPSDVVSQQNVINIIDNEISNLLFNNTRFNVSVRGIQSDSVHVDINKGFLKRQIIDGKSKIIVDIPTSKDSLSVHMEYDSYNDFVIDNNLIKVNLTKDENGNNFGNRGSNMLMNQKLTVNLPTTTTPVESIESSTSNTTTQEQAAEQNHIDYVLPNTDEDKLDELKQHVVLGNDYVSPTNRVITSTKVMLTHAVGRNVISTIDSLANTLQLSFNDIFPEHLHYYEDYNWYGQDEQGNLIEKGFLAEAIVNKTGATVRKYVNGEIKNRSVRGGIVICGPKLLNMLASKSDLRRAQGIRKLIHERLHQLFHADGVDTNAVLSQLKGIYDETLIALNERSKIANNNSLYKQGYRYDPNRNAVIYSNQVVEGLSNEDVNALREAAKLGYIRYLLNHLSNDKRLEEFLVEGMTNMTVIEFLNSVTVQDANTTEKKSIFRKILEFIAGLFNVQIRDDSLFNKYINTLGKLDLAATQADAYVDLTTTTPDVQQGDVEAGIAPKQTIEEVQQPEQNEKSQDLSLDDLNAQVNDLGSFELGGITIDMSDTNLGSLSDLESLSDSFDNEDSSDDIFLNDDEDTYESKFEEYETLNDGYIPNIDVIKHNIPAELQNGFDELVDNGIIEYKC